MDDIYFTCNILLDGKSAVNCVSLSRAGFDRSHPLDLWRFISWHLDRKQFYMLAIKDHWKRNFIKLKQQHKFESGAGWILLRVVVRSAWDNICLAGDTRHTSDQAVFMGDAIC